MGASAWRDLSAASRLSPGEAGVPGPVLGEIQGGSCMGWAGLLHRGPQFLSRGQDCMAYVGAPLCPVTWRADLGGSCPETQGAGPCPFRDLIWGRKGTPGDLDTWLTTGLWPLPICPAQEPATHLGGGLGPSLPWEQLPVMVAMTPDSSMARLAGDCELEGIPPTRVGTAWS